MEDIDTTLTPPGVQHGARQGKEIGVGMGDLQVRANPCNTHWLTRNEQVGGSSPLVGSLFSVDKSITRNSGRSDRTKVGF